LRADLESLDQRSKEINSRPVELPKKQRPGKTKDASSNPSPDLVEPADKIEEPAKVIPAFLGVAAHDDNRLFIEI